MHIKESILPNTTIEKIFYFLNKHLNRGYTEADLARELNLNRATVSGNLRQYAKTFFIKNGHKYFCSQKTLENYNKLQKENNK